MHPASALAFRTSLVDSLCFVGLNTHLLGSPKALLILVSARLLHVVPVLYICLAKGWKKWDSKPPHARYLYGCAVAYGVLLVMALLVFQRANFNPLWFHFTWEGARNTVLPFLLAVAWMYRLEKRRATS